VGSLPAADLGEHFPGCHLGAKPELDGAPQGASLTAAAQRSMSCRRDQARASRRVPWRWALTTDGDLASGGLARSLSKDRPARRRRRLPGLCGELLLGGWLDADL